MNSIVIFGAGNVASHLFKAFSSAENFEVRQVYNHRPESLISFQSMVETTTHPEEVKKADIYIIAVKDDVISQVAESIIHQDSLVIHTSGAVSLEVLKSFNQRGVFYPLQTFSKNVPVDFSNIPICIEANNDRDLLLLEELGSKISSKLFKINSEQRKSLHVAAVFVSNFVNYLYSEGESLCKAHNIPFDILKPLIQETASKINNMSPLDAQTGPAKRNDVEVINSHMAQLNEQQQKVYSLLTHSIQNLHGKEL
jgi:predicted short-subunit dehydrogenase-like oxidoreductase (DUF2520 family)